MKVKIINFLAMALMAAMVPTLASCSKEHKKDSATMNQPVEIGRMDAEAVTATATVQSIDYRHRMVTLQASDGTIGTYKLGKDVKNFKKIKVGDQVKATVLESLAVFVGSADLQPSVGAIQTVALAPKGIKPGMVVANTAEAVVRIEAVDAANRTVIFTGLANVPRMLTVGPNVDMANLKAGDNVIVRYTEAMAIVVEKP
jgi:hypothetical protein